MKDEKQDKWEDVTGECELEWSLNYAEGGVILIRHKDALISWIDEDGFNDVKTGYRLDKNGHEISFRIERRVEVEKPPFESTYTPEFVKKLDCKHLSDESVLHHCVLRWDEVVAAHEAGVSETQLQVDSFTCPD